MLFTRIWMFQNKLFKNINILNIDYNEFKVIFVSTFHLFKWSTMNFILSYFIIIFIICILKQRFRKYKIKMIVRMSPKLFYSTENNEHI